MEAGELYQGGVSPTLSNVCMRCWTMVRTRSEATAARTSVTPNRARGRREAGAWGAGAAEKVRSIGWWSFAVRSQRAARNASAMLGFIHYWGRSRKGRRTDQPTRDCQWCRRNRAQESARAARGTESQGARPLRATTASPGTHISAVPARGPPTMAANGFDGAGEPTWERYVRVLMRCKSSTVCTVEQRDHRSGALIGQARICGSRGWVTARGAATPIRPARAVHRCGVESTSCILHNLIPLTDHGCEHASSGPATRAGAEISGSAASASLLIRPHGREACGG